MIKKMNFFKAVLLALVLAIVAAPAHAGENERVEAQTQKWSFAGLFGTYDTKQLQRGFQVFQGVCAACHSANLISFRNLSEKGGPSFSEEQVKALAAEYYVLDPDAPDGERPAAPPDRWPAPFETEQDARDANGGALPPDFSVLAKARGIKQVFPRWAFNYFTAYQEGGPDYIYNLLVNYTEAPEDAEILEGQAYNAFYGGGIAMQPPLEDGLIEYEDPNIPQTVEQYSLDVAAFMFWMADPTMVSRKELGFRVLIFLFLFAGLMYLVKRKIWAKVAH